MSSYPPTPAFGVFNFVPQKVAAPVQNRPTDLSAALVPINTARRTSIPSQQSPVDSPTTSRDSSTKMNVQNIDESSDSLEEGELSEPNSASHDSSSSNSLNIPEDDEEHHPLVDASNSPNNWNQRYQVKLPGSLQNRSGGGHAVRNDRIGATDKKFDPPSQPRGMGSNRGRGFSQNRRPSSSGNHVLPLKQGNSQSHHSLGASKPFTPYDSGIPVSPLRLEAQKALLDMRECNVQFNDVIQETGVNPTHLRKLFAAISLNVPISNTPPPSLSKGQGYGVAPKETAKSNPRELSSEKGDVDKQAQMIRRQLEREQRDKERREAEVKAAEMVRQREAAKEEEARQRRSVEVQAAREAFQKKIESLNLKKVISPGILSTPISSTSVNAAAAKAHPLPLPPGQSTFSTPKIPGLLLGQGEDTSNVVVGDTDMVMKDAPIDMSVQSAVDAMADNPADTSGASQPERSVIARRKRPMAADLYSESNPIRRKFGAQQRSDSLIIEVSEDEDEDSDLGYSPHEQKRGYRSGEGSPQGTPGVSSSGMGHAPRSTLSNGFAPNGQSDALRKKEAEIQRLKEQIMAAQQKKKLSKAGSTQPTPVATPSVGSGPTIPPLLNGALGSPQTKTVSPELTKGKYLPVGSDAQAPKEPANEAVEHVEQTHQAKGVEKIKAKQFHVLIEERQQMEDENKRKQEEIVAKKIQEERERKKQQLKEVDNAREQKRAAREKLKIEMERIRLQEEEMLREEQDMEDLKNSLAKELEDIDGSQPILTPAVDSTQYVIKTMRTEIEVKEKTPEGLTITQEDIEEKSLGTSILTSSTITTPEGALYVTEPKLASLTAAQPASPRIVNSYSIENIQVNGEEIASGVIIPTSPTTSVTPVFGKMDLDDQFELSKTDMGADEQMMCDENEDRRLDREELTDYEDSSSDEAEGGEIMDTSDSQPESPASEETPVSTSVAELMETVQAVPKSSLEETNAPIKAPAQSDPIATFAKALDKAVPLSNAFIPYYSPLAIFKSFRHHPKFHEFNPSGLRSLIYSNHIDPHKPMCKYEVNGGVCNDPTCQWQHFRELLMGDDEILVELAENEGTTEEQKEEYGAGLRNTIMELKEQGIKDFATVAQGIAAYRRKFFGDETRVVKLQPPPV